MSDIGQNFEIMLLFIVVLISGVAFLYSSVGFGGATGYLAVLGLFGFSPAEMASTALLLNIVVSWISFVSFFRAGHLNPRLLLPFIATSIPAAFLGGFWRLTDEIYFVLLYAVLTFVMLRMLFSKKLVIRQVEVRPPSWILGSLVGALVGLLSGMVGIGGGIILSPIILLVGWGTPKQAAAVSAAFILFNSISGLSGRLLGENFFVTDLALVLLPFGITAALAGSFIGARRLSNLWLQRALGGVILVAVINYWSKWIN